VSGRGRPRRPDAARDAALAHACTKCAAEPGVACRSASGPTSVPHAARWNAAAAKTAAETTTSEGGTP
jgi:hypothetical protein